MNELLRALPLDEEATHAHTGAWVASVLRTRIAEGRLRPGSKLSEQSLAQALGVSRNTLREAFTVLGNELILTRIPNRGVFVASPGMDDVREIYAVRRMIEPAALQWGPELNVPGLERIVKRARAALASGKIEAMADANQRFHEEVVRASGSAQLQELMTRVLAQMRLVFHAMSDAPDFHSHYVELNASLVDLLRAGERDQAAQALRGYLDTAETELLAHLKDRMAADGS
ncbi:DNA-binding GntR family transcriptional regulator [Glutamicibacter protophormiae]|uniref:DNA-binding GntR family transcriptional regulator n=2 Tax=Glutamicibacter protophormiae TaxID=37930 RepID=A0ABS4XPV5_GLUPR|nr:GntR family transcriptional regulator [Glutamicibacter protophormiae]MBP2398538.1 DNA-binding GntR family transcriptional regulator [Glutamicibacter protophormiae]